MRSTNPMKTTPAVIRAPNFHFLGHAPKSEKHYSFFIKNGILLN